MHRHRARRRIPLLVQIPAEATGSSAQAATLEGSCSAKPVRSTVALSERSMESGRGYSRSARASSPGISDRSDEALGL